MFGLFRKKKEQPQHVPLSFSVAAPQPEQEEKAFTVGLSWKGLFGLVIVFFILQMWMFFLGMWAAQTIIFPTAATALPVQERQQKPEAPVEQMIQAEQVEEMEEVEQMEQQHEASEAAVEQTGAARTPP